MIDAYQVSHLPPMEFSVLSNLLLVPILLYGGRRALKSFRRHGHGEKIVPTLIIWSALLILLAAAMPVANFLWYYFDVDENTHITDAIAWSPFIALSAISWAVPNAGLILSGLTKRRTLAAVVSCATATYYVVFPYVYSSMQGRGLLGPGLREVLFVAITALLLFEIREECGRTMYRIFGATIIVVGGISAAASIQWLDHVASLEFSSVRF